MLIKRALPLFLILLTLTGCFRQANDSFDTVDSQSADGQVLVPPTEIIVASATSAVIIDPNANLEVSNTPEALNTPFENPTVIIIQPTNTAVASNTPFATAILPATSTATVEFITPEPVVELIEATSTPSADLTAILDPNFATPTAIGEENATETVDDECLYEVVGGDTLYGIALKNDVRLGDLFAINDMNENSVIHPGDELKIPGCGENVIVESTEEATETATLVSGEQQIYRVQSGDTLSSIASRFDTTIRAIMTANNLTNPDRLSIGQELIIPSPDATPSASPEATMTEESSD